MLASTGCVSGDRLNSLAGSSSSESSSSSSSGTLTPASGAMAAKIIFRQSGGGSFNAPVAGGTAPGSTGHTADRVFNADGSLLENGGYPGTPQPTGNTWPMWLKSFEVGISGANNTAATASGCARFASGESAVTCDFDGDGGLLTAEQPCGTPDGLYRISEYDCMQASATAGTGGPNDGIYLRATFDRTTTYLASHENILVVLEYQASVLNGAPTDPTKCFNAGVFDPTHINCSDMSWQLFMKHTLSETVQPYVTLVPPAFAHVEGNTGGSGVATKQFIVPLAGDASLTILQISRIKALNFTPPLSNRCKANSANCLGMVFHSITFFRI